MTSFQTAAGVLGGLLVLGALLSGLARRSVLSLAAVFVLAGFVLGEGATGVLHFKASSRLRHPGVRVRLRAPSRLWRSSTAARRHSGPGFGDSMIRDELERSYWPYLDAAAHDLQYPSQLVVLAARLRRQGRRPSVESSPIDALRDTPRALVACARDNAIPPDWQRRVAREELGVEPIEFDSGHSPMLGCRVSWLRC